MLTHARGTFRGLSARAALIVCLGLTGCGERDSPEAQVRAVIAAGEAAAEARDLAAILEQVSPTFRDDSGRDLDELTQYLRGYLMTHQSVHLLTRIERVEFPYRDFARVQLTVGTLGREATDTTAIDLAGDVYDVALELQLEGDEWKVVRAAWGPTRRG